jgi:hypothetical protein
MKRATLTTYPTTLPSEPADLTDRLLQREDDASGAPAARRRRRRTQDSQGQPDLHLAPLPGALPPSPTAPAASSTSAATGLETALAAADSAAEALRQAAREAPARYDVALHYRLDALAHHLQQVKEFVAALAAR